MWTKTIKVAYKGKRHDVLVYLESSYEKKETVKIQAMVNEYYLIEFIEFESRDAAYDFIKNYPPSMGKAFLIRTGYEKNAF